MNLAHPDLLDRALRELLLEMEYVNTTNAWDYPAQIAVDAAREVLAGRVPRRWASDLTLEDAR